MEAKVLFTELRDSSNLKQDIESLRKFVENNGFLILFVKNSSSDRIISGLFNGLDKTACKNIYIFKEGYNGCQLSCEKRTEKVKKSNLKRIYGDWIKPEEDSQKEEEETKEVPFYRTDSLDFGLSLYASDEEKGQERAKIARRMLKQIKDSGYNDLTIYITGSDLLVDFPTIELIQQENGCIGLLGVHNYIEDQKRRYTQEGLMLKSKLNILLEKWKLLSKFERNHSHESPAGLECGLLEVGKKRKLFDNTVTRYQETICRNKGYRTLTHFLNRRVFNNNKELRKTAV